MGQGLVVEGVVRGEIKNRNVFCLSPRLDKYVFGKTRIGFEKKTKNSESFATSSVTKLGVSSCAKRSQSSIGASRKKAILKHMDP